MTPPPVPIFVLMGTCGCGKTSVAAEMQKILGCEYVEGDSLHPRSNVEKMASGHPLNDDDRWPWLRLIRDHLISKAEEVKDVDISSPHRVVIVTCSSLRKVYRDIIREVPSELGTVCFVYLKGTHDLLLERITNRKGHFMPPSMLDSQLATLEEPDEKTENIIVQSIVPPTTEQAKAIIQEAINRKMLPECSLTKAA
ncbi:shikimate kinase [Mycotypha africana]|uniref:shikimate kinase n=1 Tax=Mycotypha africana TaxID=64632 RepID=UPI0023015FAF|nr:shikimate kinase [Mycotypha africana]KAI8991294.1 shikimate kinase [Mycotypha africana]